MTGSLLSLCSVRTGGVVKARAMLGSAIFEPAQLKVVQKAFDDAWEIVAPQVSKRPEAIEAARTKLAEFVIGLARNKSGPNAKTMTETAVQLMLADPTKYTDLRPLS